MVHTHTVHLPLGALLSPRTMCGAEAGLSHDGKLYGAPFYGKGLAPHMAPSHAVHLPHAVCTADLVHM